MRKLVHKFLKTKNSQRKAQNMRKLVIFSRERFLNYYGKWINSLGTKTENVSHHPKWISERAQKVNFAHSTHGGCKRPHNQNDFYYTRYYLITRINYHSFATLDVLCKPPSVPLPLLQSPSGRTYAVSWAALLLYVYTFLIECYSQFDF